MSALGTIDLRPRSTTPRAHASHLDSTGRCGCTCSQCFDPKAIRSDLLCVCPDCKCNQGRTW